MKINKEDCLIEVLRLHKKFGYIDSKIIKEYGMISIDSIKRRCGSLYAALLECGINSLPRQHRNVPKLEIDKEIFRIYKKFGYVSKPLIEKESIYGPKIINRIYGSFGNMYKMLDIKRHPSGYIPTDQELLDELKRLQKEYGDFSQKIIEDFCKFSNTCYKDRFGSVNKAKKLLNIKANYPGECVDANIVINLYSKHLNEEPIFEKTFEWLFNPATGCKLRIDAYFPNHNIAIEYNGPQHYEIDGRYTKDEEALVYRQYLDKIKSDLLIERNIKLITIHYKDKVNNEYIVNTLK